ncbi:MAG: PASTA domain-containing protein [Verrucomicrobiae bacterium]|nr:PASTA domain-containing protein [Verrucomicrobiae bacterium]
MARHNQPKWNPWLCRFGATLIPLLSLLGSTAQAQTTRTWDGGGADNNWTTPGNWSADNVPDTTGEAALFTDDAVGQTKLTVNLSGNVTNGQVRFGANAPGYTITGSGILYLNPAPSFGGVGLIITNGAADQTISTAQVYFLTNQTWDIGGTTILTVPGTIEDAPSPDYALTKNGTGTLIFPGDVRYDGPTTLNGGLLVYSGSNTSMLSALIVNAGILRGTTSGNSLGNSSTRNTITLAGGALELANNTSQTFGHASRLTAVTGNATIRADRLSAGAGVTHTLGTLRLGTSTLSVAPGALVNSGTAGITFGTTTLTNNGAVLDVASGANLTLGALGGNFTLTNQGNGQLTLNTAANANRTSARVTHSGGTLRLGNASALGTSAVPLTLNGGTLHLALNGSVNAHNTTVGDNAIIVSDRSTAGSGVTNTFGPLGIGMQILSVTAGANATSGTAGVTFGATTLSGHATFEVVNGGSAGTRLTLGAIGESGGARSVTKTGNGTLLLNGAGSYTGGTTLSEGVITLGVANALGSGGFNFAGGTLNANNTTDNTIGALALTANSTLNLSPGGAAATLTFAGVSGTANGMLTITGWSGVPGGLGTDDKIIFSGGTPPDAGFLQHLQFDLGGNIYPAALGAGGELHPVAPAVLVPDVVGLSQSVAESDIVAANLAVGTISTASSATVAAGIVLGQYPAAGASVASGTAISLTVSTGPTVPEVVNLPEAAATNVIILAGLSVGNISNEPHAVIAAGHVISQHPSPGTSAAIGSSVDLVVSSGFALADFVGGPTNGMSPLTVVFTNLSLGTTNYSWDFGDGQVSTSLNPANTYSNAGSYTVILTASGEGGTNTVVRSNYVVLSNAPPVLSPMADHLVLEEALLTFTVSATDPDALQALHFGLDPGAPPSASINAVTGEFSWTPSLAYASTTNSITVRVTDDGSPAASETSTFSVTVVGKPRLLNIAELPAGSFSLVWQVFPGRTYRHEFKTQITDAEWTPFGDDITAAISSLTVTNDPGTNLNRFFRVMDVTAP